MTNFQIAALTLIMVATGAIANLGGGYLGAQLAVRARQRLVRGLFLATVACLALELLAYDVLYRTLLAGPVWAEFQRTQSGDRAATGALPHGAGPT
jgi:hypothetical protein